MTTPDTSTHQTADDLATDLRDYLDSYVPQSLTDVQWATAGPAIRGLAGQTEPDTRTDLKQTLGALCDFLAWSDTVFGSLDHTTVTDANVERWFHELAGTMSDGTRSNRRSRMRRIVRVLDGEPARTKRQPRPAGPPPFSRSELSILADAAAASAPLSLALSLALASGVVPPAAAGADRPSEAEVRSVCERLGISTDWVGTLPCDPAELTTSGEWDRARRAAAKTGVNLTAARLRATWLVSHLTQAAPLRATAQAWHLTRADLDGALPHLPMHSPTACRELLRG